MNSRMFVDVSKSPTKRSFASASCAVRRREAVSNANRKKIRKVFMV
jgi:hypothetical protein